MGGLVFGDQGQSWWVEVVEPMGIKNAYFSPKAKTWLQFMSWRIYHLENIVDMVFHWSMVVECVMARIDMNMASQIIDEWHYYYAGERSLRYLFLPSMIMELCNRVSIPK